MCSKLYRADVIMLVISLKSTKPFMMCILSVSVCACTCMHAYVCACIVSEDQAIISFSWSGTLKCRVHFLDSRIERSSWSYQG